MHPKFDTKKDPRTHELINLEHSYLEYSHTNAVEGLLVHMHLKQILRKFSRIGCDRILRTNIHVIAAAVMSNNTMFPPRPLWLTSGRRPSVVDGRWRQRQDFPRRRAGLEKWAARRHHCRLFGRIGG